MKLHVTSNNPRLTLCGGRISGTKISGGGANGFQTKQFFNVDLEYFKKQDLKDRCIRCQAAVEAMEKEATPTQVTTPKNPNAMKTLVKTDTGRKTGKYHYQVIDEDGTLISERRSNNEYVACTATGTFYFGRKDLIGKGDHGRSLKYWNTTETRTPEEKAKALKSLNDIAYLKEEPADKVFTTLEGSEIKESELTNYNHTPEPKPEKVVKAKPEPKQVMTRCDAFVLSLQNHPAGVPVSLKDIVEAADKIYSTTGGGKANIKEAKFAAGYAIQTMQALGMITRDKDMITKTY